MNQFILDIIKRCRDDAMKHAVVAGIPECGVFCGIAQDLDFVVEYYENIRKSQQENLDGNK